MHVGLGVVLGPALLSAAASIGATMAIEKWGGRIGGLLGSLPTTIVPASVGLWATATDAAAYEAGLCVVPGGMLVNAGFLLCWRLLPPRLPHLGLTARLAAVTALSLGVWGAGAWLSVVFSEREAAAGLPPLRSGVAAFLVLVTFGVVMCRDAPPAPAGTRPVGAAELAARGTLAGGAIAVAMLIAASGSPRVAGIASVFPAIFLTTMVSLWVAQGDAVPVGAVGPIVLGSSSVAAYALLASQTVPALGAACGVLAAWAGAVCTTSLPAWCWLQPGSDAAREPLLKPHEQQP